MVDSPTHPLLDTEACVKIFFPFLNHDCRIIPLKGVEWASPGGTEAERRMPMDVKPMSTAYPSPLFFPFFPLFPRIGGAQGASSVFLSPYLPLNISNRSESVDRIRLVF